MQRPTPSWLSSAIFYEIYPQSFRDTNGDGIGDLPGVIEKLDYIKSLGCDAIWLNPCFLSPFGDAGYDVSDFYQVAPRYGTNADLKRLFTESHKRGIKVCLDLVAGHTSTDHPWFKASAQAKKNKYTNWFVWTDNAWVSPEPPLSAMKGCYERDGAFVINFFAFQPAINYGFANPDPKQPWQLPVDHPDIKAVRREMMKIMRFWLDMGADGFRVDMASSLVKGDHDYKETMAFWREVRAVYDRDYPDAVLIAEWSFPSLAIAAGFHVDFMIHFNTKAYTTLFRYEAERDVFGTGRLGVGHSFFDRSGRGDITEFLEGYLEHYEPTRELGYISVPTGNHDLGRLAMGRTEAELKVAFTFLMTMPGVPYIYMGDEIGMQYVEGLTSKEGGFGRTGARTPMQWDAGKNAGFSSGKASDLYLPIDPAKNRPTVAKQAAKKNSLLNHVRRLAQLRKEIPALGADGGFKPVYAKAKKYPFVYLRSSGAERILVAVNPSNAPVSVTLDVEAAGATVIVHEGCQLKVTKGKVRLEMKRISSGVFRIG